MYGQFLTFQDAPTTSGRSKHQLPKILPSPKKLQPNLSGVLHTSSRNSPIQEQLPTTNKGTPVLRKEIKRETEVSSNEGEQDFQYIQPVSLAENPITLRKKPESLRPPNTFASPSQQQEKKAPFSKQSSSQFAFDERLLLHGTIISRVLTSGSPEMGGGFRVQVSPHRERVTSKEKLDEHCLMVKRLV